MTSAAYVFGACSSATGSNTAKKFNSNRCQFTSRRLVNTVGTSSPCTFQVIVSPSSACIASATSISSETCGMPPGGVGFSPYHVPARTFSVSVTSLRYVERYSRRSDHGLSRSDESARRSATLRPLIEETRMVMIGTRAAYSRCWPRTIESMPGIWSSWMSKKTRLPRELNSAWRNEASRLLWTRYKVETRNAPKPSDRTTLRVWLPGRYKLATPCLTTYGQPVLSARRAAKESRAALAPRINNDPAIPPLNVTISSKSSARVADSPTTEEATSAFTNMRGGSRHHFRAGEPSSERRRA